MPNDVKNVTTGKPKIGGYIYYAPLGTELPTSALTEVDTTVFTLLGYISEDGVTRSMTMSSENIKDWGKSIVLTPMTEKTTTYSFTLIEAANVDVQKVIRNEGDVTGENRAFAIANSANEPNSYVWLIDQVWRDDLAHREILPNAKVTELGDVQYTAGDPVGYECTVTCAVDDAGKDFYEYTGV